LNDQKLGGHPAQITIADDAGSPETGKQKAKELITRDGVDVLMGVVASPIGAAVAQEAKASEVPVVISNAGANDITAGDVSDFVWRTMFLNHTFGYAAGIYAAENVSKSGAVLMASDYSAGAEILAGFRDGYAAAGGEDPIAEILTPFGKTQNFQPYFAQIPADASFVYAFYAGGEAITFVKDWDGFGYKAKIPLIAGQALTDEDVLPSMGDAALDIVTVALYSPALDNEANVAFVEGWREAYQVNPSAVAVATWDALQAIDLAAATLDGDVTPAGIAAGLAAGETINSPRGDFQFDAAHNPAQPWYARRLEKVNGEYVNTVIATIPADKLSSQ
jgi:branched-chain amino acid transport system substrate-binding protein